jgi:hypothetical protein
VLARYTCDREILIEDSRSGKVFHILRTDSSRVGCHLSWTLEDSVLVGSFQNSSIQMFRRCGRGEDKNGGEMPLLRAVTVRSNEAIGGSCGAAMLVPTASGGLALVCRGLDTIYVWTIST